MFIDIDNILKFTVVKYDKGPWCDAYTYRCGLRSHGSVVNDSTYILRSYSIIWSEGIHKEFAAAINNNNMR